MNNGTYPGVVVEGMLGMTSTGKEQVAVSLAATDDAGNPTGERIAWYGTFTEKAAPYTIKTLRTMGWRGDDLSDLSSIKGNPVSFVVEAEEYNGNWTPKVKWVNAPGGGAILKDQLAPDAAKAFAQRMMAKVRQADAIAGAPKVNGAPPKQARATGSRRAGPLSPEPPPYADQADGDIPF